MTSDAVKGIGYEGPSGRDGFQLGMMSSNKFIRSSLISEIVEEEEEEELFEIKSGGTQQQQMASIKEEEIESSQFSLEIHEADDVVYVVVWKGNEDQYSSISTDALLWTLNHLSLSTIVYLIHVFPELRHIPTPLGKLPISQANPEQKEIYMVQERNKRREFLQKFLDLCSASKVKVETVLIESDVEAKAIIDLIPILNIRKLVLGITKSSLRKMSRRGSGTADQILQNAPEFCDVKIICEGKEVFQDQLTTESPSLSPRSNVSTPKPTPMQDHINDSFRCSCFKPKVVS